MFSHIPSIHQWPGSSSLVHLGELKDSEVVVPLGKSVKDQPKGKADMVSIHRQFWLCFGH